ncbi:Ig-like domain-containing protein [Actinoplanes sp. NPDC000266]
MGRTRSVTIAAIVATLIVTGGTPAFAGVGDPLTVTSTGLTDGQIIGPMSRFHAAWTEGAEIVKVEVYRDGTLAYTTTDPSADLRVSLIGVPTGTEALVTVRAYGATGEWAEASTRVVVDTALPTASFTPTAGMLPPVSGVITVTPKEMSDDVAAISLIGNGVTVASAGSAPWTITYDTVGGPSYVTVRVTDRAGNRREYPGYHVDNVPPAIGALDFLGRPVGRVRGLSQVRVDFPGTVNYYEFRVDGVRAGSWDGHKNDYSYGSTKGGLLTYDFGARSRTATLDVLARDVAGNEARRTFTLIVDGTGPAITSVTPAAGALIRGSRITGTVRATDPAGIMDAQVNGYMANAAGAVSVPAGADGRKTLTWTVHDNLYNATKFVRYVVVDNTRPSLKITSGPKSGARVKGTVRIKATAADRNGVGRLELLVNGKVVARTVKATYNFAVNTAKYGKTVRVQIRAYDRAGNLAATTVRTWHR